MRLSAEIKTKKKAVLLSQRVEEAVEEVHGVVAAVEDEDQLVLVELVVQHHDVAHTADVNLEHDVEFVEQWSSKPRRIQSGFKY